VSLIKPLPHSCLNRSSFFQRMNRAGRGAARMQQAAAMSRRNRECDNSCKSGRGGRVVEGTGLENRQG
jgi:hypothetical protein